MPPTTIRTAPNEDIFTSLADHQAQTPSTFYNAKPVLHYKKNGIRAIASVDQISKLPILGTPEAGDASTTVQTLDVWISSEYVPSSRVLFLFFVVRRLANWSLNEQEPNIIQYRHLNWHVYSLPLHLSPRHSTPRRPIHTRRTRTNPRPIHATRPL